MADAKDMQQTLISAEFWACVMQLSMADKVFL